MSNISRKFKRAMALALSFVMVVSVLTVAPSTTSEAAAKKVIKSISSLPSKVTLNEGATKTVKAKVNAYKKISKSDLKVTVKTSNKKVVTYKITKNPTKKAKSGISSIKLTAKKAGTAYVTVTTKATNKKNKKVSKKIKVTVKKKTPTTVAVTGVTATISPATISIGGTAKVTATVAPANATDKSVKYVSSNSSVAAVTSNGIVTGLSVGTATITVTSSNGKTATANITVAPVTVTGVSLNNAKAELSVGNSTTLIATVTPASATNKNVTWESSNPEVATVTSTGVVQAVKAGKAIITVTTVDGSKTARCEVTVKEDVVVVDGIQLSVSGALTDKNGTIYRENTTLFGSELTLTAKVTSGGVPLGDTRVRLGLKEISGNMSLDDFSVTNLNGVEMKNGYVTGMTSANGTISFYINSSGLSPTEGNLQSFKATVDAPDVASLEKEVTSLSFASVELANLTVDEYKTNLESSTNAKFNGLYSNIVDGTKVEYVSSQQYSYGDRDHSVYFNVTPYLNMPYAEVSENKTATITVNKSTGITTNYNDDINGTMTTIESPIPVGTSNLNLVFNKIDISKYTTMYICVYDANGVLQKNVEVDTDKNKLDGNTIPISDLSTYTESTLKVYVLSKGQVNASNQGCVLKEIEATIKDDLTGSDYYYVKEMENSVKWEKVNLGESQQTTTAGYEAVAAYLPADGNYPTDGSGYTYSVTYPQYPATGNAIITAKNNSSGEIDYYAIPTKNDGTQKKLISSSQADRYRVKITEKEAKTLTGEVATNGNQGIVNANTVGTTYMKASIDVKGVETGSLYTAVQWTTLPNQEKEEEVPDFYAIKGQNVKVKLHLKDSRGEPQKGDVKVVYSNVSGLDSFDKTLHANANGDATLTLQGTGGLPFIKNLTAESDDSRYSVDITIGNKTINSKANIHWVNLGVAFADQGKNTVWSQNFNAGSIKTKKETTLQVGDDNWNIQILPVAKADVFAYVSDSDGMPNTFLSITGVPITYSSTGMEGVTPVTKNSIATVKSAKIGDMTLIGSLDLTGDLSGVVFKFYNQDGVIVTANNVGEGTAESVSKLELPIHWVNDSTVNTTFIAPNGTTVSKDVSESVVYVKVTDGRDNAIKNVDIENIVGATKADPDAHTDANGILALKVATPQTGDSTTIKVKVAGGVETSITLNYAAATDFAVDKVSYDSEAKTITVKFNKAVYENSKLLADQFVITDDKDSILNTANITKVELSAADTIVISLSNALSIDRTYTLQVVGAYDGLDMLRNIVDGNGQIVDPSVVDIEKK